MAVATAAIIATLAGIGAGAAAANQGIDTPGGNALSAAGVSAFDTAGSVPNPPSLPKSPLLDNGSIAKSVADEKKSILAKRGRASTMLSQGLLGQNANTTGTLG